MDTQNIVRIIGSEEEITRLRQFIDATGEGFDFNKVIKQPQVLVKQDLNDEIPIEDQINLIVDYNAATLVDWRLTFWGTPWTSCESEWITSAYLKLLTAAAPPRGIFRELTEQFDVKLCIAYSNKIEAGIIYCEKGKLSEKQLNGNEAEVLGCYIEDPLYTFHEWKANNKKIARRKMLDMELLFNYNTPNLEAAHSIIVENLEAEIK